MIIQDLQQKNDILLTVSQKVIIQKMMKQSFCACILVTGIIIATRNNAATHVIFKNCASFEKCRTEINETFVDETDFIMYNVIVPMYNLIEYSDNCSDTSGRLWNFKRDEIINNADVTNDNNAPSFIYKSSIIGNTENNGTKNGVKIAVTLNI